MGSHDESTIVKFSSALMKSILGQKPIMKFRNPSNTNAYYWGGKAIFIFYCLRIRNNIFAYIRL